MAAAEKSDLRVSPRRSRSAIPSKGGYSGLYSCKDLDFSVRKGEFITIVGPSGCGKSTLLDMISGLSSPTQGRILIDGQPITGPGLDRGIVFQQYALFPWKTARGNIEFGLEAKGIPKQERKEQVEHFLSLVGLTHFGDRYPHELSGDEAAYSNCQKPCL